MAKLLAMTLAIAAGLPMGKDGPTVHISACALEAAGEVWKSKKYGLLMLIGDV